MPILKESDSLEEILAATRSEIAKGAVRRKHPFHQTVLTTLGEKGPESRWVVFRKLTDENNLLIYTDWRSAKVRELTRDPHASLLFYHAKQGFQVRIRAEVVLHRKDQLTAVYWPGVKSAGSRNYNSVLPPGEAIHNPREGNKLFDEAVDSHFTIIELIPTALEVLQLGREGHIRATFSLSDGEWQGHFLVP